MPDFFIRRPIFAWVVALLISLMGLLAIPSLPIAQYPDIAPPVITLRTTYPGASAQDTEEAVTAVIEKEINGAPGLMYMSATSSSDGAVEIAATFTQGTDPDIAAVEVQNRLKIVESRLPESVRREGVFVEKSSNNIQAMISLSSTGSLNDTELGEWASARIIPELKRVKGVGRVELFGAETSMRIWPDPEKLEALGLTPTDIVNAVAAQSERIIIGDIGGAAVPESAPINAGVVAEDAFRTPEEFASIALRTLSDGSSVKLGDVARVELGANSYAFFSRCNGQTATGMAIKMAPGSNAVETMGLLKAKMDELSRDFPPGVSYQIPYETTHFVEISIRKVISTLLEAVLLVFLVMFLFLQNFRATLIPTIAVPVVLLGTFGVLSAFGYSINTLTMFAVVLAIGLLVDDAIVVVENVERVMSEDKLSPKEAARKSMDQITGALVGIAMVLSAVFIPMAFFGGSVGVIYRQFSVTIVSAMVLSVVVAINAFPTDTPEEQAYVEQVCAEQGVPCVLSEVFAKGGEGGKALAEKVLEILEDRPIQYVYPLDMPLKDKVKAIARKIYRADDVNFSAAASKTLAELTELGYGNLPVCIAKTQYSFSDNAKLLAAPTGFTMEVREVRLAAGAGFVVVICGNIMTMPGLPKKPAAVSIDVDADGKITGLF